MSKFKENEQPIQNLIVELDQMVKVDQEMRNKHFQEGSQFNSEIDKSNTQRLKEIVEEFGWPTITLVGKQASTHAWLIVQHAVHDTEFQKKCLELMKAVPDGEVSKQNIAYLSDRLAVYDNEPQLYGTQFSSDKNGNLIMGNIIDPKNLDKRRAEVGLESFAMYLEKAKGYYSKPKNG